ncbi:MAG: glycosyltransferase family 2 protein [Janthinobacterium lividum]
MADGTRDALAGGAPLVSVAITAYHSAAWLPRAIESALRQQAGFPIEIVIGDDCSADDTARILQDYQQRYPSVVRVLQRTERLGMQRNFYDVFEQCQGKYIAWLDADDSWTDPQKLALQVAVLEADNSVSVCGHFVRQVSPAGAVIHECCPSRPAGRYRLRDIIATNFVPSPTILFRNGVQRSLPPSFFSLTGVVDWPILLQSALVGDILLLDRVMADYVLMPGSAYQGKGPLYQDEIDLEFYAMAEQILPQPWQRAIRAAKGIRYDAISYHLLKQGQRAGGRSAALLAFCLPHPLDNIVSKFRALALAAVFHPVERLRRGFRSLKK